MPNAITQSIYSQFSASIEMLENAILLCPEWYWDTERRFWYNAYHCLFFLDYYLTMEPKEFVPPAPFTFSEFEDVMPERVYTKNELLGYLHFCQTKFREVIADLTVEGLSDRWINESGSMNFSVLEILLYNMRHVQHHAAQLNLLLRQGINDAPDWVFSGSNDV